VEWSSVASNSLPDWPTAVLLHGILGGRKNWGGYLVSLLYRMILKQLISLF
ncbi:hypothetical protein FRX31_009368, partial [Thalictrum thalictroides]